MLQGTLDVFSLDEVLGLLSGANKNGVLNITGDRGVGSVSIADGFLVAGSASSAPESTDLPDVVFELLRYEEGSFSFDGAAEVEGDPQELTSIMTEAHTRLEEWKSIEAVVPSLDHHVTLTPELTTSQVTLSESEWAAVVAIGEGASVGVVARRLGLGEFDGSKRMKALIERSLASLEASAAPIAESFAAEPVVAEPVAVELVAPTPVKEIEDTPATAATSLFQTPEPAPASFAPAAEVESETSLETVAPDAPAFEDAALDAGMVDSEIPPMPEVPSFGSFGADDDVDAEIPPMPEPPASFAAEVEAPMPPPPAAAFADESLETPAAPTAEAELSSFAGLDPIGGADIFEEPRRGGERSTDNATDGFTLGDTADLEASVPPPPASADAAPAPPAPSLDDPLPSFAPPASFDADAFSAGADFAGTTEAAAEAAAEDTEAEPEKGGSLLMRYLKSNG